MSTLSPELQHKQWLSVSNIYTRDPETFSPGMPMMAYKTPVPEYSAPVQEKTTFQQQFPSKGGAIPCDQYATAGATPAQWCEPWGGECPLGRRVIPSRRADPVMIRPVIRQKSQTGNIIKKDNSLLVYIVLALLVLFFIRLM